MDYEIHIYLEIFCGDNDPHFITEITGIKPTSVIKKGDHKIIAKNKFHEENSWKLESKLTNEVKLEEHINYILDILKPSFDKFKEITQEYYTKLFCVLYPKKHIPEIFFDKQMIKQLSELNLDIDFDIYI